MLQLPPLLSLQGVYPGAIHVDAVSGGVSSGGSLSLEIAFVALLMIGLGVAAYSGLWRAWSRTSFTYPLGIGVMGVGLLVVAIGKLLDHGLESFVLGLGLAVVFVGACAMIWIPRVLLPDWYRARKQMRQAPRDDKFGGRS